MPLRVRCSTGEFFIEGEDALAALYRRRLLRPGDLVWHPARALWIQVEAFLFMDSRSHSRDLRSRGETPRAEGEGRWPIAG